MDKIREIGLEKYIGDKVEVEDKYTIKKILGYGATSVVYKADFAPVSFPKQVKGGNEQLTLSPKAKPDEHRKEYAIKCIQNVFDSSRYAHRILREIKLMKLLRGHPNIVKLKNIMRPRDTADF